MSKLLLIASACLQLGIVAAIVIYSIRQMVRIGARNVLTVLCALCTAALTLVALFICSGSLLEKVLTRDAIENAGLVAMITMVAAALVAGFTALVCLLRRSAGWRLVFLLQMPICLYLALVAMYAAMGKPFAPGP